MSALFDNEHLITYAYSKKYPEFTKVYKYHGGKMVFNPSRTSQSHSSDQIIRDSHGKITEILDASHQSPEQNYDDSLRRTKTTMSDIVLSNHFDMFATFTFNCNSCKFSCSQKSCSITDPHEKCDTVKCDCPPELCSRLDPETCKQRMSKWLENQQRIHGKFNYLIVPEWHKNGGLHFHAMLKNYKGNITQAYRHKSRKTYIHNGQPVFNITSYRQGFTTIKLIPNDPVIQAKVSNYLKKYITKDMPVFHGRKRYWCSKFLLRPEIVKGDIISNNPYVDPSQVQMQFTNDRITILKAQIKNHLRNSPLLLMLRELQRKQDITEWQILRDSLTMQTSQLELLASTSSSVPQKLMDPKSTGTSYALNWTTMTISK